MKAYEEITAGPLAFPIGGKTYTVPEIEWAAGLKLQEIDAGNPEDVTAEDQWRLLLGPIFDEMIADKVPAAAISRVCLTALTDYRTGNREWAEQLWESGHLPELPAVQETAPEPENTTRTDAESSTPNPASGTGTTTRRARQPKKKTPSSSASST